MTVEYSKHNEAQTLRHYKNLQNSILIKRHHLQLLGYSLVSLPYWEWDEVRWDTASEEAYLRSKISASFVHDGPRRPCSIPSALPRPS